MTTLNFAGVQASGDLSPIPDGTYEMSVVSVKPKTASTGSPMLEWVFEVESGNFTGRRVFSNTILLANSLWRTKDFLIALGFTDDELNGEFELVPSELIGLRAYAIVGSKMVSGTMRNEIIRLVPSTTTSVSVTPPVSSADAPVATRTWDDMEGSEGGDGIGDAPPDLTSLDDVDELDFLTEEDIVEEEDEAPAPVPYVIPSSVKISATARAYAMEHRVDLAAITPSGPGKTYMMADLKAWVAKQAA